MDDLSKLWLFYSSYRFLLYLFVFIIIKKFMATIWWFPKQRDIIVRFQQTFQITLHDTEIHTTRPFYGSEYTLAQNNNTTNVERTLVFKEYQSNKCMCDSCVINTYTQKEDTHLILWSSNTHLQVQHSGYMDTQAGRVWTNKTLWIKLQVL